MKVGLVIALMVIVAALVVFVATGAAVRFIRRRNAKWVPGTKVVNGKRLVFIEKYPKDYDLLEAVPLNDPDYDQRIADAESEAFTRCVRENTTERILDS